MQGCWQAAKARGGSGLSCAERVRSRAQRHAQATVAPAVGGSGSGGCVQLVAQDVACPGTMVSVRVAAQGKLKARRGLLARAEEGNVIENEGVGGRESLFINLVGN